MTQLLIHQLPPEVTPGSTVLRHWLILGDGRLFFQDETLTVGYDIGLVSTRTDWEQLPTPPTTAKVAGTFEYGGLPGAIMDNGKAYLWAVKDRENEREEMHFARLILEHRVHEWPHEWRQFHEPIPGTIAHEAYNR